MTLAYIIAFPLLGSVLSLVGGVLLLLKNKISKNFACSLISFAAGALIGVAFLDEKNPRGKKQLYS